MLKWDSIIILIHFIDVIVMFVVSEYQDGPGAADREGGASGAGAG